MSSSVKNYWWVPSFYFMQGLPFAVITFLTAILYKEMGISNESIAFFAGLLGLPWIIKPLWSPIIEIISTKRKWVISVQLFIGVWLFLITAAFFSANFFYLSLFLFFILALGSATFDIASDGFYMLNLDFREQASFVGIRVLFYLLARCFCTGGIIMLIGWLQKKSYSFATAWQVGLALIGMVALILAIYHWLILPEKEVKFSRSKITWKNLFGVYPEVFRKLLGLKGIITLVIFLFGYNAADSQLMRIAPLFLLDKAKNGGMGLTVGDVGLVFGFVGTMFLTLGALVVGAVMRKFSCAKVLVPVTFISCLLNCGYVFLISSSHANLWLVTIVVVASQFGFGLANGSYMAFLMNTFSKQKFYTSYYAVGTGIMALGMMFFGMLSGYFQTWLTYHWFFWWIIIFGLITCFYTVFVLRRYEFKYF